MAQSAEQRRASGRATKAKWREKNRETDRARARGYYHRNKEKCRARNKAYAAVNREALLDYGRKWNATLKGRAKKLVRAAAARAKATGVPYSLDWEWLYEKLLNGRCEATGMDLVIQIGLAAYSPSLDRFVPELGYTKSNTRVVIYIFNTAKNEFTDDHVIAMARALLDKRDAGSEKRRNNLATPKRPTNRRSPLPVR